MLRILIILVAVLALVGAALVGGYALAFYEVPPLHNLVQRVDRKTNEILNPEAARRAQTRLFRETTFFDLDGTMIRIPRDSWASGGALEVWSDDELAVISKEGEVFVVGRGNRINRTPVEVPDNGLAAYNEMFEAQANGYRFNDIMVADGAGRRDVYLSGTYFDREGACYMNRLWRASLPLPAPLLAETEIAADDWEVVYDTQPCLSPNPTGPGIDGLRASGRMTMGLDGMIYLISGDYGLEGVTNESAIALDPESDYGKILQIDPETGEGRMFSQGHRNPGGVAFDREGRLWAIEHGVRGGDELNLIEDGNHYGWPHVSLGTAYNGMPLPDLEERGRHTLYTPPVFAWLPSVGMTALTYIDGFDDRWDGDLLAGSLSSPEFGHRLFRIRIQDGRALFAEEISAGDRVRDVVQWGDTIAVLRDDNRVVLFEKVERVDALGELEQVLAAEMGVEAAASVHAVVEECSQCHSFTSVSHRAGPSLKDVVGRPVAGTDFEGYSEGLRAMDGVWTAERVVEFAADPEAMAPGTAMPAQPVGDMAGLERALEFFEEFNRRQVAYD